MSDFSNIIFNNLKYLFSDNYYINKSLRKCFANKNIKVGAIILIAQEIINAVQNTFKLNPKKILF